MTEIWKSIKGYEGLYEVSNLGHVRSLDRVITLMNRGQFFSHKKLYGQIMSSVLVRGYPKLTLSNDERIRKLVSIHRLLAEAFIPNPENKPQVNHINGVKTDNRLENLEWNTSSENILHAFKIGLSRRSNSLSVLNTQTGIFYDSIVEAAKSIGKEESTLRAQLHKGRPTSFIFA